MSLKLSHDRKVSPYSKLYGSGNKVHWTPQIPNSLGLPAHLSCPGKTTVCESICYAYKIEKVYKGTKALLQNNYDLLKEAETTEGMAALLRDAITEYLAKHNKVSSRVDFEIPKVFRIHWDGDFFSIPYAEAWKIVIEENPEIQFWAYTRSFQDNCNVVPTLVGIDNLSLYLSTDSANANQAKSIFQAYPSVRIAALDASFAAAETNIAIEVIGRKAPKCPEQTGRYSLVVGSNANAPGLPVNRGTGACVECDMCIDGKNHVLFSISKK